MSVEQKEVLKGIDILKKGRRVQAFGTIINIEGEKDKESKKQPKAGVDKWVGTVATITLSVNGVNQKVRVMGSTRDNYIYNKVKAFAIDKNGDILRDDKDKALPSVEMIVKDYDPKTHVVLDRKTVSEFTGNTVDGKKEKITLIDEITQGRFANALIDNKALLIGKRVSVMGTTKFSPNQDYTKIELEMEINAINIQKTEEGKTYREGFRVESPLIISTEAITDSKTEFVTEQNKGNNNPEIKLMAYVPVYNKYVKPIIRDNKEVKGRTVYVPMGLDITNDNFLRMGDIVSFDLLKKLDLFRKMLLNGDVQDKFIAIHTDLSYKSGVVSREVNIEDLKEDPIFSADYVEYVNEEDVVKKEQLRKDTITMYKQMNPSSVRGEFKQSIELINYIANKEHGNLFADIEMDNIEIYTLDKIKEEQEVAKGNSSNVNTPETPNQPKVESQSKSAIKEPVGGASLGINDYEDEFPFN